MGVKWSCDTRLQARECKLECLVGCNPLFSFNGYTYVLVTRQSSDGECYVCFCLEYGISNEIEKSRIVTPLVDAEVCVSVAVVDE